MCHECVILRKLFVCKEYVCEMMRCLKRLIRD